MSFLPPFRLHNLHQVITSSHVSTSESTPSDRPGSARTVPPQSPPGHLARCLAWARETGRLQHASQFAARLNGRQVSEELFEQFRITPAFGRDLAERLDAFHEPNEWMTQCGWERWSPATDQATVAEHSWRRGDYIATDVLPRNAILSETDNCIRAIDFIVAQVPNL
jgi:hypothetical protein